MPPKRPGEETFGILEEKGTAQLWIFGGHFGKKVKLDGPIKRLYIDARMDNPWPKEIQL